MISFRKLLNGLKNSQQLLDTTASPTPGAKIVIPIPLPCGDVRRKPATVTLIIQVQFIENISFL